MTEREKAKANTTKNRDPIAAGSLSSVSLNLKQAKGRRNKTTMTNTNKKHYNTIEEIKEAHERGGKGYFFKNSAFFDSVIYPEVYGGSLFITSEQEGGLVWDGERRYTVRRATDAGAIETASEFGEFKTHEEAKAAILNF